MAYPNINGDKFADEIFAKKEFAEFAADPDRNYKDPANDFLQGRFLRLLAHQLFCRNFLNPNTPYRTLLAKHAPGTGKSLVAIAIAQNFIIEYHKIYNIEYNLAKKSRYIYQELDKITPTIFVIGFTKANIIKELLKYPELGFISVEERYDLSRLQKSSMSGDPIETKKLKDLYTRLKRRITAKDKNGFYSFIGYRELVNILFISDQINLIELEIETKQAAEEGSATTLEELIEKYIAEGKIRINEDFLARFENGLIICDEVHNTYNAFMKNNYGVAIQYILNRVPTTRAVLLSGTPINNSPSEIIDLLNLLRPNENIKKEDYFADRRKLKDGALEAIGKLAFGRVSFLQDINPKFFPEKTFYGAPRKLPRSLPDLAGNMRSQIPYLDFIECPMSDFHYLTYAKYLTDNESGKDAPAKIMSGAYTLNDMVFPNPEGEYGLYDSKETVAKLTTAPSQWKAENGVIVQRLQSGGMQVGGDWLASSSVGKYSAKYARLIELIEESFAASLAELKSGKIDSRPYEAGEKIMIYHNRVKMSGVFIIQELLKANGVIEEFADPIDSTRCSICGGRMGDHENFIGREAIPIHTFYPARLVIAHSDVQKVTMDMSIAKFNIPENCFGTNIKFLIGSKIIKESYDIKDVRRFFIMSITLDISALIQVFGRCYRQGSHANLPVEKRTVKIGLFLTTIPADNIKGIYPISAEEFKYFDKLLDYEVIQDIEREVNSNAIDGHIFRNTIMPPNLREKFFADGPVPQRQLGDLYFEPKFAKPMPAAIDVSTFDAYHHSAEVNQIKYILKRLFAENTAMKYETLWQFVREPPFGIETNPKMFAESNFVIALEDLTNIGSFENERALTQYVSEIAEKIKILSLINPADKFVYKGDIKHYIQKIGEYYVAMPWGSYDINAFNYEPKLSSVVEVSVSAWLEENKDRQIYESQKAAFIAQYKNVEYDKIFIVLGAYDAEFYNNLIRDIIVWYIDDVAIEPDVEEFYFNLLTLMEDLAGTIKIGDVLKYKDIAKKITNRELVYADGEKFKSQLKEDSPIGYLVEDSIMIYDSPNWIKVSKIAMNLQSQFKENDVVVGYFDKLSQGMKFKYRMPVQHILAERSNKREKADARLLERGMVCETRPKETLIELAAALKIDISRIRIKNICEAIKFRLLELELEERKKRSRVKYFYMWYENMPLIK